MPECGICWIDDPDVEKLLNCNHYYHKKCLDQFFDLNPGRKKECQYCFKRIIDKSLLIKCILHYSILFLAFLVTLYHPQYKNDIYQEYIHLKYDIEVSDRLSFFYVQEKLILSENIKCPRYINRDYSKCYLKWGIKSSYSSKSTIDKIPNHFWIQWIIQGMLEVIMDILKLLIILWLLFILMLILFLFYFIHRCLRATGP